MVSTTNNNKQHQVLLYLLKNYVTALLHLDQREKKCLQLSNIQREDCCLNTCNSRQKNQLGPHVQGVACVTPLQVNTLTAALRLEALGRDKEFIVVLPRPFCQAPLSFVKKTKKNQKENFYRNESVKLLFNCIMKIRSNVT